VQKEIGRLQDTINTLIKRKTYKRQYIYTEKTLIVSKVSNLIAIKKGSSYKESKIPAKRVRAERRYSCYSEIRYNFCTCKVEILDVDNSNASK
jgi:hypothetical protein